MQTMMRGLAAAAALFLAAPWASASACSMIAEYVRPTNFELVQISDSIVVATARAQRPEGDWTKVLFDVGEKVKGEAPSRLELPGGIGKIRPSDLDSLAQPHPEAGAGMCNRITFRKGGRYLLFLQKDEKGQLRATGEAFSRINEDYAGEDTVWMRTVRRYLRIQATAGPMEQLSILAGLAERGHGPANERLTPAEIADIRDHLSSLSPHKPTAYLLAAYAALERGRTPDHGVRARSADREQSQADTLARFVFDGPAEGGTDHESKRRQVLTALVNGRHPDAMPLFDRLATESPEDPASMGLVLRYFTRNGAYGRAFQWIEARLMDRLAKLDPQAAMRLVADVAQVQSAGGDGKEPWRDDPRAAALWPELALSLYWYQVRTFGADQAISFGSAIRTLPHQDYRARPPLTLALARSYEKGITEWAVSELLDEAKRKAWEDLPEEIRKARDDPAALPLQIMLFAWHHRYQRVPEQVFCQSEARRLLLIRTLGEVGGNLYSDLIEQIAASPLSAEEREALPAAIEQWGRRNDREWMYEGRAARLVAEFRQGKKMAAPIKCGRTRTFRHRNSGKQGAERQARGRRDAGNGMDL